MNLYEYSEKARDEFLSILKKKKILDRIWIPYQVGKEYHSRRPNIIREQKDKYRRIQGIINDGKKTIISDIEKQKNIEYHPFIDRTELKKSIDNAFSKIDSYLSECEKKYPDLTKKDNIGEEIDKLFENKVGDEYTRERLKELYETAKKRFDQKIPPGFEDQQKGSDKQYWDYISWVQIMEYAKSKEKSVIFINDDEKNDWWSIHEYKNPNQEIIAPHPELIKEFFLETQQRFYMYNSEKFMKSYSKFLKEKVSSNTITEVRNLRNQQFQRDMYLWAKNNPNFFKLLNEIRNLQRHGISPSINHEIVRKLQKLNLPQEFIAKLISSKDGELFREKVLRSMYKENMAHRHMYDDNADIFSSTDDSFE